MILPGESITPMTLQPLKRKNNGIAKATYTPPSPPFIRPVATHTHMHISLGTTSKNILLNSMHRVKVIPLPLSCINHRYRAIICSALKGERRRRTFPRWWLQTRRTDGQTEGKHLRGGIITWSWNEEEGRKWVSSWSWWRWWCPMLDYETFSVRR